MASYKAALSAFTAAREAATQERKKKLNAKRSRAVSAYTLFYNEQFDATKAELGTPKELGNVARSIASKWKALSDDQKTVRPWECAQRNAPRGPRASAGSVPRGPGTSAGSAPRDREPVGECAQGPGNEPQPQPHPTLFSALPRPTPIPPLPNPPTRLRPHSHSYPPPPPCSPRSRLWCTPGRRRTAHGRRRQQRRSAPAWASEGCAPTFSQTAQQEEKPLDQCSAPPPPPCARFFTGTFYMKHGFRTGSFGLQVGA